MADNISQQMEYYLVEIQWNEFMTPTTFYKKATKQHKETLVDAQY